MSFVVEQQRLIEVGKKLTDELQRTVTNALGLSSSKVEVKRHAYIYSPPGAGKTFTVQAIAHAHRIELVKGRGAASMNAFMTQLATTVHLRSSGSIVVWIDDCDGLFMQPDSLNVMKGALDEERNVLAWNKNMTMAIDRYAKSPLPADNLRAEALRQFQAVGSVGIEVPTDRIRFIITSNKDLAPPAGKLTSSRKMHEAAIRDRVNYRAFELTSKTSWGWVAYVLLTSDVLGLNAAQKEELLKWMLPTGTSCPRPACVLSRTSRPPWSTTLRPTVTSGRCPWLGHLHEDDCRD